MGKQATEWAGAEPAEKDFDAQALEILNWMEWWSDWGDDPKGAEPKGDDPKKDDQGNPDDKKPSGDDPAKSEDDAWKSKEDPKPNSEDELKIPRSRLNKEIEKRKSVEKKLDKIQKKYDDEVERLKNLSDDEKEEQENLKKLWMDTRLSKLEDMIEDLKDQLSDRDDTIKWLNDTISQKETSDLSSRISELTKQHDWKDGLPKFDIKELIQFGKDENYMPKDPLKLYQLKYQAEIYAKQYEKSGTEIDKGNKGNFEPKKKNLTFDSGNKDFDSEAKAIIDSFGEYILTT